MENRPIRPQGTNLESAKDSGRYLFHAHFPETDLPQNADNRLAGDLVVSKLSISGNLGNHIVKVWAMLFDEAPHQ